MQRPIVPNCVVVIPLPKMGPRGDRDPETHPYKDYVIHLAEWDRHNYYLGEQLRHISGFNRFWTSIKNQEEVLKAAKSFARVLAKQLHLPWHVLKKAPSEKIYIECDCSCVDECPQGRVGAQRKCRILKVQDA